MHSRLVTFLALAVSFGAVQGVLGQAHLPIYTDNLVNRFEDWGWATRNLANTTPVHSGTRSISATATVGSALSFYHSDFNVSPYASVSFWAHGGASGTQRLDVYVQYGPSASSGPAVVLPTALTAGVWTKYTLTLASLGMANRTNVNRVNIRLTGSGGTGTFYVDDIQIDAAPAPALVHVNVNAAQTVRTADMRWFGLNTAVWDSFFDTVSTSNAVKELGTFLLRFPGGSLSDEYHWATGTTLSNPWSWVTSWGNFMHVATNAKVQAMICVNYGTGTSNEAAAWVRSANITNHCNFKYWEIGNECYGSWETDSNAVPHDPYTYAVRAAGYISMMKAADPTIKIGLVAVPGEDSYVNNTLHPATNPRTGLVHNGWTPVMLTTLRNLGVTPDFLVHHVYPQWNGPESDPLVLQSSSNWAKDAADLRQQLADYLAPTGTNVEILCTENNSNSGQQGKQSTSIVNGLYLADSLSQLMKTEINGYVWWDLRNGADTSGSFDPTIYGWRSNGDLGIILNSNTRYPTFYADKLMQYFVGTNDSILNPTSDYLLLSAYAARKADGKLALLVLNKDTVTNFTAQIAISGFVPESTAIVRSYGLLQDEATRTGSTVPGAQDIYTNTFASASTNFTYSFPRLTLTLLTFAPSNAPTTLTVTNLLAVDKVYDATTNATLNPTNAGLFGVLGGDDVSLSTSNAFGYFANKNIGVNKPVTVGGLALYGTDAGSYLLLNPSNVTASITPAPLNVAGVTAANKVYDGTTVATLTGTATLNGVLLSDVVTLITSNATAAFADPNVGTSKPVTVLGYDVTGADAGNYALSQPVGLAADILPLVTPAFTTPQISKVSGGWQLNFDAQPGQSYQVLASDDLALPLNLWTVVTNGIFGPGPVTILDDSGTLPNRFYRIVSP